MNFLRRAKSALPYLATGILLLAVAAISHYAPSRPGGGLAAAVEESLKD